MRSPGPKSKQPLELIVCDFDGTITDVDTGALVLTKFSHGDWKHYHEQYLRGALSFEEALRRQFALVGHTTKASILRLIDAEVHIRGGFEELLSRAEARGVSVAVASYGLDFCIDHMLGKLRLGGDIRIHAPKTILGENGIALRFPRRRTRESVNLKDDVVLWYKRKGFRVTFVGDGASDFPAIKKADRRFVIKDSELARMCAGEGIGSRQITSFWPVTAKVTDTRSTSRL